MRGSPNGEPPPRRHTTHTTILHGGDMARWWVRERTPALAPALRTQRRVSPRPQARRLLHGPARLRTQRRVLTVTPQNTTLDLLNLACMFLPPFLRRYERPRPRVLRLASRSLSHDPPAQASLWPSRPETPKSCASAHGRMNLEYLSRLMLYGTWKEKDGKYS